MRKRVFLVGLIGGIVLVALLFYPLYYYLPSGFVEGWVKAANVNILIFLVGAILILLAIGAFAARMSGVKNRIGAAGAGALAGIVSAAVVNLLIGGASSGIWGAQEMLSHGLHATSGDAEFITFVGNTVTAILWWENLTIGCSIIAGIIVGGLGGLLAGKGSSRTTPQSGLWLIISAAGSIASSINLITVLTVYSLLVDSIRDVEKQIRVDFNPGYELVYSPDRVLIMVGIFSLLSLLIWQFVGWRIIRKTSYRSDSIFVFVGICLLVAPIIFIPLLIGMISFMESSFSSFSVSGLLISLSIILVICGIYLFAQKLQIHPIKTPEHQSPMRRFFSNIWGILMQLGSHKIAALFFFIHTLLTALLIYLFSTSSLFKAWVIGGLLIAIILASLSLWSAWKPATPGPAEAIEPKAKDVFSGSLIAGSFFSGLTLLNILTPLSVVLIPIKMISVLAYFNESEAAVAANGLSLSRIVNWSYLLPVIMTLGIVVIVILMAILATSFWIIWKKVATRNLITNAVNNPAATDK